jgi:hypothetical protein
LGCPGALGRFTRCLGLVGFLIRRHCLFSAPQFKYPLCVSKDGADRGRRGPSAWKGQEKRLQRSRLDV